MTPSQLRIGPAGWSYPDWEGTVYPPHGSKFDPLAYLSSFFDTIEINSPFYRVPPPTHAKSWVRRGADKSSIKIPPKNYPGVIHDTMPPPARDLEALPPYLDPPAPPHLLRARLLHLT